MFILGFALFTPLTGAQSPVPATCHMSSHPIEVEPGSETLWAFPALAPPEGERWSRRIMATKNECFLPKILTEGIKNRVRCDLCQKL